MSIKKFRHSLGRLLGIRRYLFMAEPGKTLDLDGLIGPAPSARPREDVRTEMLARLAEHRFRPRGAVHCGVCSAADLGWYASAGFGRVLVLGEATVADAPAGLAVLRSAALVRGHAISRKSWEDLLASHAIGPAEFTFFRFTEPGWPPMELPASVEAVSWCCGPEGGQAQASATPTEGRRFVAQGLNLAWLGPRSATGTAEYLFLRRPVVTMSDFGRNGRFGNQLFQRTYLRLVALCQGAILQLPLWAGTALFETEEPLPSSPPLPLIREENLDVETRELLCTTPKVGFAGMDYSGYGMSHTRLLAGHKKLIRAEYSFESRLTARFDAVVGPRLAGGKKLVVIHLRRGDYGYGQFFRAPCAWYQAWMSLQGFTPDSHVLYIASEDPDRYRARFAGFTVITADALGTPPELAPYFDFLAMTQADALAIANSSFSFFAAMLNTQAIIFSRPDALQGLLVPFDPWDAEPLLDQKLSPEEHARLKKID